jgi:hypothetical protein
MRQKQVDIKRFVELHNQGIPLMKIGEILGVGWRPVARTVKQLGLNKPRHLRSTYPKPGLTKEIGSKYSFLTIDGTEYSEKLGCWVMLFTCDCGRKGTDTLRKIKKNLRRTCGVLGCPHRATVRQENGKMAGFTGYGEIYGCRWAQWRIGAEKRGLEFKLSIKRAWQVFEEQDGRCALTGLPINFGNSWNRKCTASLDRIDSTKGYIEGNVQWVHKRINMMKGDLPEVEFLEFCKLVIAYTKNHERTGANPLPPHASLTVESGV